MNRASTWWIEEKRASGGPRLQLTEDLDRVATSENVVMITGFVPTSSDDQLVGDLRTELSDTAVIHAAEHIYYQGWTEIQIQHPLADKGTAVAQLVELTGLHDSTLIACGDHLNDLGMFAAADESVAPANAHPAALSTAASTTASNEDDGIIAWRLDRTKHAGK